MTTFDAYTDCAVCGGKGFWYKHEKIGQQVIQTPIACDYCGGKGQILSSKLKLKPLFDSRGQPIDQNGRILRNPDQEPYSRRMRRKQYMEELYGKEY
jgi:hypothetical protein